jgi:hypothetical protein
MSEKQGPQERAQEKRARARLVARKIKLAWRHLDREWKAAEGSDAQREATESARDSLFMAGCMIPRDNPAKFLRLVAAEFDGKLKDRIGPQDEKIIKVWDSLVLSPSRSRSDGLTFNPNVSFPDFREKYRASYTSKADKRVTNFTLRRALKRLGRLRSS